MMGPEAFKMIVSKPDKGPLRRILREAVSLEKQYASGLVLKERRSRSRLIKVKRK